MSGNDTLRENPFSPRAVESAMQSSLFDPANNSVARLQARYASNFSHVQNLDYFASLLQSLCDYIIERDDKVVARALHYKFNIGRNKLPDGARRDKRFGALAVVLSFWQGCIDESITTSTVERRKRLFLDTVRRLQRNGNIRFVDNYGRIDHNIDISYRFNNVNTKLDANGQAVVFGVKVAYGLQYANHFAKIFEDRAYISPHDNYANCVIVNVRVPYRNRFIDMVSEENDFPSCPVGVKSIMVEAFSGMHPDIRLYEDVASDLTRLLVGFIVDHLLHDRHTYGSILNDNFNFEAALINEQNLIAVKQKIKRQIRIARSGILGAADLEYIDATFTTGAYGGLSSFGDSLLKVGTTHNRRYYTEQELDEIVINSRQLLNRETNINTNTLNMAYDLTRINIALQAISREKLASRYWAGLPVIHFNLHWSDDSDDDLSDIDDDFLQTVHIQNEIATGFDAQSIIENVLNTNVNTISNVSVFAGGRLIMSRQTEVTVQTVAPPTRTADELASMRSERIGRWIGGGG